MEITKRGRTNDRRLSLLGAHGSDILISHVVKSATNKPGALPLLADLFTDLWERMQQRGDGMLRVSDRREIIQMSCCALQAR